MPRAGEIDYTQGRHARPRHGDAEPGRPEAAAGPDRARQGKASSPRCSASRRPRTASTSRRRLLTRHLSAPTRSASRQGAETPSVARRAALRRGDGANKPTLAAHARGRAEAGRVRHDIGNGDVLIAAITSCTNTSNPSVMLAAGLLAKKAVEAGLKVAAAHQDLAGAGLAHRHRVPDQGRPAALPRQARLQRRRLRLHDLHRQRRRPDAGAQRRDHEERPRLRRGALGQPQLRGAHPPEPEGELPRQPAAGRRLRDRRQRCYGPDDRAGRQGQGRQGHLPRRHLADQRRGRRADEVRA